MIHRYNGHLSYNVANILTAQCIKEYTHILSYVLIPT